MIDTENNRVFAPSLLMMVGLPASGKSYVAAQIAKDGENYINQNGEKTEIIIHSSDKLREELYGDVNEQSNNKDLFEELHKRIKDDLSKGSIVIYDATNINKKRRRAFLNGLKGIECKKICVPVLTPYECCIERNQNRNRSIPEDVITRMYKNFQPPSLNEGFDSITLIYNLEDELLSIQDYTIREFFYGKVNAVEIDQENKHHNQTIGEHCLSVYRYLNNKYPDDIILKVAGLLHDVGKPFTKTNIKPDGTVDTEYHYYHHANVGSYDSFFYTMNLSLDYYDRIEVANLIYYHMLPLSWQHSKNAEKRHRSRLGEDMYWRIKRLNEADVYDYKEEEGE